MWKRGSCLIFALLLWAGTQAWAQETTRQDSTQGSGSSTTTTTTVTTRQSSENYNTNTGHRSNEAVFGFGPILGIYHSNGGDAMRLTGGALARLESLTPAGCDARIDVTITDEGPLAQAMVVISAVPRPSR